MKYLVLCLVLVASSVIAAPFPYLQKKEYLLNQSYAKQTELTKTVLSFDPKYFKEINVLRKNLPKENPMYTNDSVADGIGADDILLGSIDLTGANDLYYITLSDFPSYDINYNFYKVNRISAMKPLEYKQPDFTIYAPSLIVPSNGNIYAYGHNNNNYSLKRKFIFKNSNIVELDQPFAYVGVTTTSLKDQVIYSDVSLSKELYKVSKGTPVTIVGIQTIDKNKYRSAYLVASEFGLVGYVVVESEQSETQFSGFYFNGD
jgi:hypothetical protein